MPKFEYIQSYDDVASLDADVEHLREVLPETVTGSIFRDIPGVVLKSDTQLDLDSYGGSTGWLELSQK